MAFVTSNIFVLLTQITIVDLKCFEVDGRMVRSWPSRKFGWPSHSLVKLLEFSTSMNPWSSTWSCQTDMYRSHSQTAFVSSTYTAGHWVERLEVNNFIFYCYTPLLNLWEIFFCVEYKNGGEQNFHWSLYCENREATFFTFPEQLLFILSISRKI